MGVNARRVQRVKAAPYTFVRQTNPARTEVYGRSNNWLATFTDGCATVVLKGASRTFTEHDMPVQDLFDRTRANDWGALTLNGSWSTSGAADATNTSVSNGTGRMTVATASSAYRATVVTHDIQDVDAKICVQVDKDSAGATITTALVMGYQDGSNYYYARVTFELGGQLSLRLYKMVAATSTALSPSYATGLSYSAVANEKVWIRATMSGGVLQARVWKDGTSEPGTWQVTANDTTYSTGRVGVRSYVTTGATNMPVIYSYASLTVTGAWSIPPTVTHSTWVRVLPAPFGGSVDTTWLTTQLQNTSDDILAYAMQYIQGAPTQTDGNGVQYAGDASYGPLETDGSRTEGADFYDYLNISWNSHTPRPQFFRCVDCSGAISLVYGYRGGLDNTTIPANARGIAASGPGVVIVPNSGAAPVPAELTKLQIGDIVCFDNDTSDGTQIDHAGIYMGVDMQGKMRVYSSRKGANGPTISDIAGDSVIGSGTGTYAQGLRVIRRF